MFDLLARISGLLLAVYVLAEDHRHADLDQPHLARRAASRASQYYDWKPFGTWILFAEIVLFGLVPALILLAPRAARAPRLADSGRGAGLLRRRAQPLRADHADAGAAHAIVRQVPHLHAELAGDRERSSAVVAYGVLVYSFSFRYFQLFPQERELQKSR